MVIPIERLNDYMRQVMKVEPFFCNVDSRSELTVGDMSAGHMDMLRDVWSEDFNEGRVRASVLGGNGEA